MSRGPGAGPEMEVADVAGTGMSQTEQTGQRRRPVPRLGTGRNLVLNAGAALTILLGVASFALGMVVRNVPSSAPALHVTATVTGVVALVLGLYLQMISATRNERIIIVTGIIGGFVGACLGLAAGGFSG